MKTEHETDARHQTNRLSGVARERLRAWAFLEGVSPPGALAARIEGDVEAAITDAAERDPLIDEAVSIALRARDRSAETDG